jgi:hypothetical protein
MFWALSVFAICARVDNGKAHDRSLLQALGRASVGLQPRANNYKQSNITI